MYNLVNFNCPVNFLTFFLRGHTVNYLIKFHLYFIMVGLNWSYHYEKNLSDSDRVFVCQTYFQIEVDLSALHLDVCGIALGFGLLQLHASEKKKKIHQNWNSSFIR